MLEFAFWCCAWKCPSIAIPWIGIKVTHSIVYESVLIQRIETEYYFMMVSFLTMRAPGTCIYECHDVGNKTNFILQYYFLFYFYYCTCMYVRVEVFLMTWLCIIFLSMMSIDLAWQKDTQGVLLTTTKRYSFIILWYLCMIDNKYHTVCILVSCCW